MGKIIVLYESKYGNTAKVAEGIVSGLKETPDIDVVMNQISEVSPVMLADYDTILIGSPNHMGKATKNVRQFIDSLEKLGLEGKTGAVFDTYISNDYGKAVKNMEKSLGKKAPGIRLLAPGLSIKVKGMKGPVLEDEMPKTKEFGRLLAKEIIV